MFLTWMKQKQTVYSSKISDFQIGDITFEVGGRNKKGKQLREADKGYIVKDNIEYAVGKNALYGCLVLSINSNQQLTY